MNDFFYYLSFTLVVISAIGLGIDIFGHIRNENEPNQLEPEIKKLNEISENLENLKTFIEKQKTSLIENENLIQQLTKEKEELEPIVNTNRDTIESILFLHAKNEKKTKWKNHLFGFFIGVLSSALVTYLSTKL